MFTRLLERESRFALGLQNSGRDAYIQRQISRAYSISAAYKTPTEMLDKNLALVFSWGVEGREKQRGGTAPSSGRIGRNFQIEPRTRCKQGGHDAGFTGRLGREVNSNSIDDGLGSLTRASYQRPSETPSLRRCPKELCDIPWWRITQKKEAFTLSKSAGENIDFDLNSSLTCKSKGRAVPAISSYVTPCFVIRNSYRLLCIDQFDAMLLTS